MPLYVNGEAVGKKVEVVDVSEKIAAAIRENHGRIGDLEKYTVDELRFIRETMKSIANEKVIELTSRQWLEGVDISRVVEEFETYPGEVSVI